MVVVLSMSDVAGIVAVSVKQPHAEDSCVFAASLEKHTGRVAAARTATAMFDPWGAPRVHCDGKTHAVPPPFSVTVVVLLR
jgi:Tfp pilus assembly protein FimV